VHEQAQFTQVIVVSDDCKRNSCLMRANADLRLAKVFCIPFMSSDVDCLGRTYRVNADVGVSHTKLLHALLVSILFFCAL
jgi:hypothetical protein